ncbi:HNH endonuclease [Celeribacter persicus]|nr:HNH endonuclease signature motif containing protein [Celeribacter persicus]
MMERYIPAGVRRQLRQEAGFGCCVCGAPFVEYHHIIPWSEKQHNDPEHMIALCPSHHTEVAKLTRQKQYDLKFTPHNIKTGQIRGTLISAETEPSFIVGGNTYINTPKIFTYYDLPLITYDIIEGERSLSLYFPDNKFWPELRITNNQIAANPNNFWDIDFHHNLATFRKKKGKKFLEIDFRNPVAELNTELEIRAQIFRFSPTSTNFGTNKIAGAKLVNCVAGIGFGSSRQRLLVPNFAQRIPRPLIQHKKTGELYELNA